jgi:hypothetical protein
VSTMRNEVVRAPKGEMLRVRMTLGEVKRLDALAAKGADSTRSSVAREAMRIGLSAMESAKQKRTP